MADEKNTIKFHEWSKNDKKAWRLHLNDNADNILANSITDTLVKSLSEEDFEKYRKYLFAGTGEGTWDFPWDVETVLVKNYFNGDGFEDRDVTLSKDVLNYDMFKKLFIIYQNNAVSVPVGLLVSGNNFDSTTRLYFRNSTDGPKLVLCSRQDANWVEIDETAIYGEFYATKDNKQIYKFNIPDRHENFPFRAVKDIDADPTSSESNGIYFGAFATSFSSIMLPVSDSDGFDPTVNYFVKKVNGEIVVNSNTSKGDFSLVTSPGNQFLNIPTAGRYLDKDIEIEKIPRAIFKLNNGEYQCASGGFISTDSPVIALGEVNDASLEVDTVKFSLVKNLLSTTSYIEEENLEPYGTDPGEGFFLVNDADKQSYVKVIDITRKAQSFTEKDLINDIKVSNTNKLTDTTLTYNEDEECLEVVTSLDITAPGRFENGLVGSGKKNNGKAKLDISLSIPEGYVKTIGLEPAIFDANRVESGLSSGVSGDSNKYSTTITGKNSIFLDNTYGLGFSNTNLIDSNSNLKLRFKADKITPTIKHDPAKVKIDVLREGWVENGYTNTIELANIYNDYYNISTDSYEIGIVEGSFEKATSIPDVSGTSVTAIGPGEKYIINKGLYTKDQYFYTYDQGSTETGGSIDNMTISSLNTSDGINISSLIIGEKTNDKFPIQIGDLTINGKIKADDSGYLAQDAETTFSGSFSNLTRLISAYLPAATFDAGEVAVTENVTPKITIKQTAGVGTTSTKTDYSITFGADQITDGSYSIEHGFKITNEGYIREDIGGIGSFTSKPTLTSKTVYLPHGGYSQKTKANITDHGSVSITTDTSTIATAASGDYYINISASASDGSVKPQYKSWPSTSGYMAKTNEPTNWSDGTAESITPAIKDGNSQWSDKKIYIQEAGITSEGSVTSSPSVEISQTTTMATSSTATDYYYEVSKSTSGGKVQTKYKVNTEGYTETTNAINGGEVQVTANATFKDNISKVYIPKSTFTVTAGALSAGSTSITNSNSSIIFSDTNNGLDISAYGVVYRDYTTYKGTAGYYPGDTEDQALDGAEQRSTTSTKYISAIHIPENKKLNSITINKNASIGTISSYGEITNLIEAGKIKYFGKGTIEKIGIPGSDASLTIGHNGIYYPADVEDFPELKVPETKNGNITINNNVYGRVTVHTNDNAVLGNGCGEIILTNYVKIKNLQTTILTGGSETTVTDSSGNLKTTTVELDGGVPSVTLIDNIKETTNVSIVEAGNELATSGISFTTKAEVDVDITPVLYKKAQGWVDISEGSTALNISLDESPLNEKTYFITGLNVNDEKHLGTVELTDNGYIDTLNTDGSGYIKNFKGNIKYNSDTINIYNNNNSNNEGSEINILSNKGDIYISQSNQSGNIFIVDDDYNYPIKIDGLSAYVGSTRVTNDTGAIITIDKADSSNKPNVTVTNSTNHIITNRTFTITPYIQPVNAGWLSSGKFDGTQAGYDVQTAEIDIDGVSFDPQGTFEIQINTNGWLSGSEIIGNIPVATQLYVDRDDYKIYADKPGWIYISTEGLNSRSWDLLNLKINSFQYGYLANDENLESYFYPAQIYLYNDRKFGLGTKLTYLPSNPILDFRELHKTSNGTYVGPKTNYNTFKLGFSENCEISEVDHRYVNSGDFMWRQTDSNILLVSVNNYFSEIDFSVTIKFEDDTKTIPVSIEIRDKASGWID